jgi:pyruvate/2-oxoglutarate dehydrogenase complex dihydrolipoamide acyltransferase (E2) component
MSRRAGQIVATVVAAAALAASSHAAAPEPSWMRALWIRSDALNQRYSLGEYNHEDAPTAEPSWRRALRIRGEALNRTHRTGPAGSDARR